MIVDLILGGFLLFIAILFAYFFRYVFFLALCAMTLFATISAIPASDLLTIFGVIGIGVTFLKYLELYAREGKASVEDKYPYH